MQEVIGSIPIRATNKSTTYGTHISGLVVFGSELPKPQSNTGAELSCVRSPLSSAPWRRYFLPLWSPETIVG